MNEAVEDRAPVGQSVDRRPGEAPEGTVFMSRTKSFTRRTRELPANLVRTWEAHAHRYVVEPRRGVGYTTVAQDFTIDLAEIFGRNAPVTLEIGSGTGEQIVAAAAAHPERDFLALEVWVPGIAKLVSKAAEAGVDNIRVIEADAAQALPIMLEDACLDEVWTFFPDPWRKARHRKFFENPHVGQRPDPEDPQPQRGGFAPRFEGRVVTHFETRGIDAGRHAHDIVGIRRPRG